MNIIDGKKLAEERRLINAEEIAQLAQKGIKPSLAVVLVGDNDASKVYVRNKIRACEKWGIKSIEHRLPASTTEEELIALIKNMNEDSEVNGILVQLPLPSHICEETILNLINPEKDVDGFSFLYREDLCLSHFQSVLCPLLSSEHCGSLDIPIYLPYRRYPLCRPV